MCTEKIAIDFVSWPTCFTALEFRGFFQCMEVGIRSMELAKLILQSNLENKNKKILERNKN